jgi:hypothetical protein
MRFRLGGYTQHEIETMIETNVMVSAAHHPLPATCHMPHAHATHQSLLNKSRDRACRSIFGRSRVFDRKLLADGKL